MDDQNQSLDSVFDALSSSGNFNVSTQKVLNYVNASHAFLVVFAMTFDTNAVCLNLSALSQRTAFSWK